MRIHVESGVHVDEAVESAGRLEFFRGDAQNRTDSNWHLLSRNGLYTDSQRLSTRHDDPTHTMLTFSNSAPPLHRDPRSVSFPKR